MKIRDDLEDEAEDWGDDPIDEDEDDDQTIPCPHCGELVFEEAELCPNCGQYLSLEDSPRRKPWWVVAGVLTCLGIVTWWIFHP